MRAPHMAVKYVRSYPTLVYFGLLIVIVTTAS